MEENGVIVYVPKTTGYYSMATPTFLLLSIMHPRFCIPYMVLARGTHDVEEWEVLPVHYSATITSRVFTLRVW